MIFAGTLYAPALVAIVGGMATVPASAIDYQLFKRALALGPIAQANQSRISLFAQRAFLWQPWWTVVIVAFSPIPFYPVRLLAPMSNYPAPRYVVAVVVGRVPRYYLLAWGGSWAVSLLNWNPFTYIF